MYDPQGNRTGKILFDVDKLYDTIYHWAERSTGSLRGAYRDVLNQIEYLKRQSLAETGTTKRETDEEENVKVEVGDDNRGIRIATINGKTLVELGGKTMGSGVIVASFEHNCKTSNGPELKLVIDCNSFRFEPDGYFDKALTHRSHEG